MFSFCQIKKDSHVLREFFLRICYKLFIIWCRPYIPPLYFPYFGIFPEFPERNPITNTVSRENTWITELIPYSSFLNTYVFIHIYEQRRLCTREVVFKWWYMGPGGLQKGALWTMLEQNEDSPTSHSTISAQLTPVYA